MNILKAIALCGLVNLGGFGFSSQVSAETIDCSGLPRVVCQAAVKNAKRAPYQGPIRPANEPMACARIASYGAQPVAWVDATHASRWRDGTEIKSTAVVHTETFPLVAGWVMTESCIPRRLLNKIKKLVLCTGLDIKGFHYKLDSYELQRIKQTGHFSSYVPFLKKTDQARLSKQQVRAAYKVRYGI